MKKIELYGLPCSGKTFISNILKEKINQDNKSLHTYQSAFFEYVFYEKKINFIEFLSLKYFKYFKKNKDTNFLKNIKKKSVYKKKTNLPESIIKLFIYEISKFM